MLLTIILLFIISWLPLQIAILYSEYRTDTHLPVSDTLVVIPYANYLLIVVT